jgi:glucan 1,3-beta-glucosidase
LTEAIPGYEEQVYGITVGSEGLYRYYQQNDDNGGYTSTKLAGYLTEAMKTWPNISIGTADTTSSYVSGWADEVIRLVPSML